MNKKLKKREFVKLGFLGTCGAWAMSRGIPLKAASPSVPGPIKEKHTREAMFYRPTARGMKCQICPNECQIEPGEYGDCRTRLNKDNKLSTIAYGNPCAVHVDPIEKKPLYHFLPQSRTFSIATAGCNLACLNCQNWEISQASPLDTRNHDLMPDAVVQAAEKYNCRSIAYTYSDPVAFYEYTYDTARLAKTAGLKNVIVSAGYINPEPLRELCSFIDAANIDLKSFSNEIYEMLNAGTLQPVLDTLKILKDGGVWLEITNLIVPDWTDDPDMIRRMCGWLAENGFSSCPIHFSRFHPQYKLAQLPPTPLNTLEEAYKIAKSAGLNHVFLGNVPGTGAQHTTCPECGKLLIKRAGFKILENKLEKGHCPGCQTRIAGVWS